MYIFHCTLRWHSKYGHDSVVDIYQPVGKFIYHTTESHNSVVNIYQPVGKFFIAPLSQMFVKCFIGIYECFRSCFSVFYFVFFFSQKYFLKFVSIILVIDI